MQRPDMSVESCEEIINTGEEDNNYLFPTISESHDSGSMRIALQEDGGSTYYEDELRNSMDSMVCDSLYSSPRSLSPSPPSPLQNVSEPFFITNNPSMSPTDTNCTTIHFSYPHCESPTYNYNNNGDEESLLAHSPSDLNSSCDSMYVCDMNSISCENLAAVADFIKPEFDPSDVVSAEPRSEVTTPQQVVAQYVLRHHLLPHFRKVTQFIIDERFVPSVSEDDVRAQQGKLLEVSGCYPSVDKFLQSYNVVCPEVEPETDDDMRKIFLLKKVYNEEVVKLDTYCSSFVERLANMLEEQNKFRPVYPAEVQAKAMLIHNRFQLLRNMLTKHICSKMLTILAPMLRNNWPTHSKTTQVDKFSPYKKASRSLSRSEGLQWMMNSKKSWRSSSDYEIPIPLPHNSVDKSSYVSMSTANNNSNNNASNNANNNSSDDNSDGGCGYNKTCDFANMGNAFEMKKRRKKSLSRTATDTLSDWFNEHISDPYPTEQEKKTLAQSLGIHLSQVNNWFGNKRIRHRRKALESMGSAPSSGSEKNTNNANNNDNDNNNNDNNAESAKLSCGSDE